MPAASPWAAALPTPSAATYMDCWPCLSMSTPPSTRFPPISSPAAKASSAAAANVNWVFCEKSSNPSDASCNLSPSPGIHEVSEVDAFSMSPTKFKNLLKTGLMNLFRMKSYSFEYPIIRYPSAVCNKPTALTSTSPSTQATISSTGSSGLMTGMSAFRTVPIRYPSGLIRATTAFSTGFKALTSMMNTSATSSTMGHSGVRISNMRSNKAVTTGRRASSTAPSTCATLARTFASSGPSVVPRLPSS